MMVGEMDFGDLFFGDSTNYSLRVNYEAITYIIFTSFIIVMMIIIMNLLVRLWKIVLLLFRLGQKENKLLC